MSLVHGPCLHSKQAAVAYAYLMTLPVMFTLRSSVTSPLSAPICLLPATQREEERGCTPTREHLLLSEPVNTVFKNKKERAVDRKVVREVCSCRDAAVTAQQLAAYASSPVVRVSSSSYPTAPVSDPLCAVSHHPCLVHLWRVFYPASIINFQCHHAVCIRSLSVPSPGHWSAVAAAPRNRHTARAQFS